MDGTRKLILTSPLSFDSSKASSPKSIEQKHINTNYNNYNDNNVSWGLTKKQKAQVAKFQQEIKRGGLFQCIFPTSTSYEYFTFILSRTCFVAHATKSEKSETSIEPRKSNRIASSATRFYHHKNFYLPTSSTGK